jgi:hypothetical protein
VKDSQWAKNKKNNNKKEIESNNQNNLAYIPWATLISQITLD